MNPAANRPTPRLVTIGSLNMDLVLQVDRMPQPGETIQGRDLAMIPGGKGANQAVGVALLGGSSIMIGRVGDDIFGRQLRQNLETFKVDTQHVQTTAHCSSGVALINVETGGQNSITIVGGANHRLTPQDLLPVETVLRQADALILQLEIPLETVAAALDMARVINLPTILDPAPAPPRGLPDELYAVDILSPNQSEAALLTGIKVHDRESAEKAALVLLDRGARHVILKMGSEGALLASESGGFLWINAFDVTVVDTTAAGDAFTAGLAVQHAMGTSLQQAIQFACAAGSLATTKLGAQPSLPSLADVQTMIDNQKATSML